MADKFNGFSHDEIMKITGARQNNRHNTDAVKQVLRDHPGIRRMPDKLFKQADQLRKQQQSQHTQRNAAPNAKAKASTSVPTQTPATSTEEANRAKKDESLNLERPLSDSLIQALYYGEEPTKSRQSNGKETPPLSSATHTLDGSSEATDDSSILKINTSIDNTDDDVIMLSTASNPIGDNLNTDSPFKGISLKDFEIHRKMIEEQNKQKKQMLYQAIEQHTQKTAAESRKIEEIRHELSKLESDLAVDVAILRKQIDNACIHFANVEKQYIKIEAQFLKAKIELHNASEKKELLTEHLCTVIAHNEDRKAQKLTELMHKVGLAPSEGPIAAPES